MANITCLQVSIHLLVNIITDTLISAQKLSYLKIEFSLIQGISFIGDITNRFNKLLLSLVHSERATLLGLGGEVVQITSCQSRHFAFI